MITQGVVLPSACLNAKLYPGDLVGNIPNAEALIGDVDIMLVPV